MGIGAGVGALAGMGVELLGAKIAATPFFSHFGMSGSVAAYGITGTAMGAGGGYGTGFSVGAIISNGDWDYARRSGEYYAGVGAGIGGVLGALAGGFSYEPPTRSFIFNDRNNHTRTYPSSHYGYRATHRSHSDFIRTNYLTGNRIDLNPKTGTPSERVFDLSSYSIEGNLKFQYSGYIPDGAFVDIYSGSTLVQTIAPDDSYNDWGPVYNLPYNKTIKLVMRGTEGSYPSNYQDFQLYIISNVLKLR
jgi:hypothetical protein